MLPIGATLAVVGGAAYFYSSSSTSSQIQGSVLSTGSKLPIISAAIKLPQGAGGNTAVIEPLTPSQVESKLRQDAVVTTFSSANGAKGHVHAARVASNDPVEDEFSIAELEGVGRGKTLFAGVYDGHA